MSTGSGGRTPKHARSVDDRGSDKKKRDRALQRRVRERQAKTGESYQAAWQQLANDEDPSSRGLSQGADIGPGTNATGEQVLTINTSMFEPGHPTTSIGSHLNSVPNTQRIPLPLSTAVPILPGQFVQITARPQIESFWPDRLLIKNADHWHIERLTVGMGKSPWSSLIDGPQRGSVFSLDTWHPLTALEVSCDECVSLVVSYTGSNEQGESLEAVMFGWEECPPRKPTDRNKADNSERVSEQAESKSVRANEMAVLSMAIRSPALFVDHFTIRDAKDWIVNDIRTRGKSIFLQNGDLPGEMFSGSAPVILEPLAADDRVDIAATYVGNNTTAHLVVELSGTAEPKPSDFIDQRAVSCFLPLSTDVQILPKQSAQITGRSRSSFLLERLIIADPDDWIVNDIKIGNRALLAQGGDLPGQAFSSRAVGCAMTIHPVSKLLDFKVVLTRGESCKEGAGFFCGVQGLTDPRR